jgi:hypothetical protein
MPLWFAAGLDIDEFSGISGSMLDLVRELEDIPRSGFASAIDRAGTVKVNLLSKPRSPSLPTYSCLYR